MILKSAMLAPHSISQFHCLTRTNPIFHHFPNPNPFLRPTSSSWSPIFIISQKKPSRSWTKLHFSNTESTSNSIEQNTNSNANLGVGNEETQQNRWRVEVGGPVVPSHLPGPKLSLSDQAFFLLAFIACTTSVAFMSLVIAAVPTLYAMGRAAISLSKLADTAREELPSTMAAIRLSGMEISDLTLELSDLSQEIAEGVNKSAEAVQAAKAGIRQIGSVARQRTMSMIEERANLPPISLQPLVAGAAKKTSRAVGNATKSFINLISGGELGSKNQSENTINRLEI
ncbi:uncharacterized protein LOC130785701 [Actinidia eriantha]|uniref:uncharacterized protein LOC130785701 n=1 Tax=Actinidia eriantha TaxID=165200 RepID=UPI00258AF21A|nr:uncharacterized protein LOC130785701 [Actinidia eriantha]